MGAELPAVQSEFAKLKTVYLEYQTQQRFMEMLRNEDADISREGDDEKAQAESCEKLLIVQEKSAELAQKIGELVKKFGDVATKLDRNKIALKSIENVEKSVREIENQKMDIDEDEEISTKTDDTEIGKKAEEMKADAENQSRAAQIVHEKNTALRNTVNSLEEQVRKMRVLFEQGKANLKTQRERRNAIETLENQTLETLKVSKENAKQAQTHLEEIQAKCAETSKKTTQESKKYEAKRKSAETQMSLLEGT